MDPPFPSSNLKNDEIKNITIDINSTCFMLNPSSRNIIIIINLPMFVIVSSIKLYASGLKFFPKNHISLLYDVVCIFDK